MSGHEHEHHEHEHHEHGEYVFGAAADIDCSEHEGASVCTFRFSIRGSSTECDAAVRRVLQHIGVAVQEKGGFIGHIKAFTRPVGGGVRYSFTGRSMDTLPIPIEGVICEGVAIVMNLSPEELEQLTREKLCLPVPENK